MFAFLGGVAPCVIIIMRAIRLTLLITMRGLLIMIFTMLTMPS